ncbi:MAG: formylglycine-generating enzyme family protein [endosymbiont of Escarpia spicata]|uniref:Formylglycine-generating enzyme family protein n=1 Tax=endosymbiont of Escarpia spicata TaxID=2200908 RepID=A0A370DHG5_9GAMM|nr:MAG: formylglycine-generating enzyme family protein [endosymbiont of Escarpia spicata]
MRWIAPGSFSMGSPQDEHERDDDEGPQHTVQLSHGYWLFDTTVTQVLWQAVMGNNRSRFQGDDRPVVQVSWDDCQEFVKKINAAVPGLELNLPSEAQWEYACRAGTATPFSQGENINPGQINYDGNYPYRDSDKGEYRQETLPVMALPPNPWGLYQMHGNVWEWCLDGKRGYTEAAVHDPLGPTEAGARRVFRGGSWGNGARGCRSACRLWDPPDRRNGFLGFRPARVQE